MAKKKKKHPKVKLKLHPRNKHRERYDLKALVTSYPELQSFVLTNEYGDESVDFADPLAVKALNTALLIHYYGITEWSIPRGYLCPPIPGRADYIHNVADLLRDSIPVGDKRIPTGKDITCLDVGVGANIVYPIIGVGEYGWSFIGSDIDEDALANAAKIVAQHPALAERVELRHQKDVGHVLKGVLKKKEFIDVVVCNPPFHTSAEDAQAATERKWRNLKEKKVGVLIRNFGGQFNELWCQGGEAGFIRTMIFESVEYRNSCFWFSTIVSRYSNLKSVYANLEKAEPLEVKEMAMGQGNKTTRVVAWTFLNKKQQAEWIGNRWAAALKAPPEEAKTGTPPEAQPGPADEPTVDPVGDAPTS